MEKSLKQKQLMQAALGSVLALGIGAAAQSSAWAAASEKMEMERCAGIVKEGMNDCATSEHSCAGKATEDYHPDEWIHLPKGSCEKIAGATVLEGKGMEM